MLGNNHANVMMVYYVISIIYQWLICDKDSLFVI